mmetsp:Transcript_72476/g.234256  ORF Transcript_72476/g.234256 Transcript_72476/m.234256 type:complete len:118 (-) Transcript_72476:20-373(-)
MQPSRTHCQVAAGYSRALDLQGTSSKRPASGVAEGHGGQKVVKADPDAVFSADALRQHLGNYKGQASSDRGVYMKNCEAGPRGLQLFGSMELLSLGAMKTFGANRLLGWVCLWRLRL